MIFLIKIYNQDKQILEYNFPNKNNSQICSKFDTIFQVKSKISVFCYTNKNICPYDLYLWKWWTGKTH